MAAEDGTTVAVLGGGIGGLSAAHELAERGFSVTVYEKGSRFGGKARSLPGPRSGGTALPAEHGFRFFPGFYQHITDTMSRIPHGEGSVKDNLVETTQLLQATTERLWIVPTDTPETPREHRRRLQSVFGGADIPMDEKMFFLNRVSNSFRAVIDAGAKSTTRSAGGTLSAPNRCRRSTKRSWDAASPN